MSEEYVEYDNAEQFLSQFVTLSRRDIKELWLSGILPNATYVYFALECERKAKGDKWILDTGDFIDKWAVEDLNGKMKSLTIEQVKKGVAGIEARQKLKTGTQIVIDFT